MGPSHPLQALMVEDKLVLNGMAIMSTHPRDWDRILQLKEELTNGAPGVQIVPTFGVHPWFLHQVDQPVVDSTSLPAWLVEMEENLIATPGSIVGEIGLDGFHFDPHTKELTSPMEKQVRAFALQMELAGRLQRNVSIHTVHCFGPLMNTLSELKKNKQLLPPQIYFHAFGGKEGTVDQLLALCGRQIGKVYFGFAPIINFRSPKTASLIRKVGIERLLLETDHEDAARVPASMEEAVRFLAEALNCSEEYIVEKTTANAFDFYNLQWQ